MRILFWSSTFRSEIGGVGVLAERLLSALRRRGFEFLVITPQDSPDHPVETEYGGIPIYRFPFWRSMVDVDQLIEIRQKLTQLKRTFTPDLVHINAVNRSNFFYHLTAGVHPAPLLVTLHGVMVSQADDLMKRTLRSADWVAGCSEAILEKARRLAPEITPGSSVIHNGLDVPTLQPAPLSFDPPSLLCLGRLVEEKGFDVALDAFASLLACFPKARLIIAGDGPARAGLEHQASILGIGDAVEFTGWITPEKVPELINTASVVVMPSRWEEPFGLVALEAALMFRPIVATRVGGLPEIVVHQQTGLLVERENSKALSEAVAFLLEHPEIARRMGRDARIRVEKEFSWQAHVGAYDALYRKLITGGKVKSVRRAAMS